MFTQLRANLILLVATLFIAAVVYPLAVLAVGQGLFPTSANGSLVNGPEGQPVGSRLIAQEFKGDEWFQPRPSAAGYNASASAGSNFGANNPKLRERVEETLKGIAPNGESVPADAVTASGSGLDPHITLANAKGQLDRVVGAWVAKSKLDSARVKSVVEGILNEMAFNPLGGLAGGDPLLNVLELNLEMRMRLATKSVER